MWVISLGMELVFSRKARPKDQGIVERAHQTMQKQLSSQQGFNSLRQLTQKANHRRQVLNYQLDCHSCNQQPPLIAYPQAKHSGRHYEPENEINLMNLDNVYQYLEKGLWIRKVNAQKRVVVAGQAYSISQARANDKVRVRCCAKTRQFTFEDNRSGRHLSTQPVKKLDLQRIQGTTFQNRNQYGIQLKIPYPINSQIKLVS